MRSVYLAIFSAFLLCLSASAQGTSEAKVFKLENRNAQELLSLAQQMVTPGGSASLDERTNSIVATGTADQLDQLGKILAELDGTLKQVALSVYVTEVEASLRQQYGLDLAGTTVLDATQFDAVLDLIDRRQGGQIYNSMNATTMSGSPAYLQVSTDQFVTLGEQTNSWGSSQSVVERVPVGQFLTVDPRVKPDGSIDIALTPTVSRSNKPNDITVRSTATHVIVPDGGAIAIGQSAAARNASTTSAVPFISLGDSGQTTDRQVIIFLTATTASGTNMLPVAPNQPAFDNPEVLGPKRQIKSRERTGPGAR
ncbi:hypothetical protein H5P28_18650 [Ruficoccus amylovorans]|uniref:NolW-like domain-containing protein n=1 Tax=Ruficoccus amylovorans TaxID=1804625 RepID=A0A842HMI2_9BACT|nr:secretin N-terminal domain-containing protein [Ruficoccus amylovorans]MBC2596291.1 hypothetical protein [Ruficoccus amylovorans]